MTEMVPWPPEHCFSHPPPEHPKITKMYFMTPSPLKKRVTDHWKIYTLIRIFPSTGVLSHLTEAENAIWATGLYVNVRKLIEKGHLRLLRKPFQRKETKNHFPPRNSLSPCPCTEGHGVMDAANPGTLDSCSCSRHTWVLPPHWRMPVNRKINM